eukprot:294322-Prymnesium_polylepis.1
MDPATQRPLAPYEPSFDEPGLSIAFKRLYAPYWCAAPAAAHTLLRDGSTRAVAEADAWWREADA